MLKLIAEALVAIVVVGVIIYFGSKKFGNK